MGFLLLKSRKVARASLYSTEDAPLADFQQGETRPLSVGLIDEIPQAIGSQVYTPLPLTGWTFRAGLGNGFLPPVAGTFTITSTTEVDGTETTDPIPYNPTAQQIADALNAHVTGDADFLVSEEFGLFIITFGSNGPQSALSGNPANLAPLCILEFGQLIAGGDDNPEVQTLRIVQNPAAYTDLATASAPAAANVTVNRIGGSGYNHKITVDFNSLIFGQDYQTPYGGQWTIIIGGVESALIDYNNAGASDVQAAIAALSSVGAGNVLVAEQADGSFTIAFQGTKANTNMGTIETDPSLLSVIPYLSGTLDLRTPGIDLLLGGQDNAEIYFEIEGTPPSGTVQKLLREQVNLLDSILDPSDSTPQPFDRYLTEVQSDARYQQIGQGGATALSPVDDNPSKLMLTGIASGYLASITNEADRDEQFLPSDANIATDGITVSGTGGAADGIAPFTLVNGVPYYQIINGSGPYLQQSGANWTLTDTFNYNVTGVGGAYPWEAVWPDGVTVSRNPVANDANWVVLKPTVNLTVQSDTECIINGVDVVANVATNVGWVDPLAISYPNDAGIVITQVLSLSAGGQSLLVGNSPDGSAGLPLNIYNPSFILPCACPLRGGIQLNLNGY